MMAEPDSYAREKLQKQTINIDDLLQASFGESELKKMRNIKFEKERNSYLLGFHIFVHRKNFRYFFC